jgi:hypothetical protein
VDGIDPFSGMIRDWHHSAKVRHDGASWTKRRRQHEKVRRHRRVGAAARLRWHVVVVTGRRWVCTMAGQRWCSSGVSRGELWWRRGPVRRQGGEAAARVGAWRMEDAAVAAAQDGAAAALGDAADAAERRGCEAAQGGRRAGKEKKKIEPSRLYID